MKSERKKNKPKRLQKKHDLGENNLEKKRGVPGDNQLDMFKRSNCEEE